MVTGRYRVFASGPRRRELMSPKSRWCALVFTANSGLPLRISDITRPTLFITDRI